MLGVVSPPGVLFGVGAFLILLGAGTASMVTLLPHTEVFDATDAVKAGGDKRCACVCPCVFFALFVCVCVCVCVCA